MRSVKAICATSFGSTQCASRLMSRGASTKGLVCPAQLGELRAEVIEHIGIEAGADAAAIMQFAALELTQQQRGECAALLVGDAIAADDKLLVAEAL